MSPDSDPATPVGYFPRLLSTAAHVSNQAADAALEQYSLNRDKLAVLTSMAHGSRTAAALSAEAHVGPPQLAGVLASLQESGYVLEDPESGQWSATPCGLRIIERARAAETTLASEAGKDRQLRAALQTLIAALQNGGGRESGSSSN